MTSFGQHLINMYPRLFRDIDQSMVSVPPGWRGIILKMLEELSPYLASNKDMRIVQIKSKFGGLRVYHEGFCDMCIGIVEHATYMAGDIPPSPTSNQE